MSKWRSIFKWIEGVIKWALGNALWDWISRIWSYWALGAAAVTALITGGLGWVKGLPIWEFILVSLFCSAVVCLLFLAVRGMWLKTRSNKRTTVSNIPVECGPDVKGSVSKANGYTFYRARIEPTGSEQFPNLIGKIHSIKRDGVEMDLAEVIRIKFCPGDLSAPCARRDDPAFLDVVYVNPRAIADLHVHFWPAGMTHWSFEPRHTYNLDVAILSDGVSRRCDFEFVWTGDANTSSCRLIRDKQTSLPSQVSGESVHTVPKTTIELLDDLILEGESIEKFCGDMSDGEIAKSKVDAWIAKVLRVLRQDAPDYVASFNDAVAQGGAERLYPQNRHSRTVVEMGEWASSRVRQKAWQVAYACLLRLKEIRKNMRTKLPL